MMASAPDLHLTGASSASSRHSGVPRRSSFFTCRGPSPSCTRQDSGGATSSRPRRINSPVSGASSVPNASGGFGDTRHFVGVRDHLSLTVPMTLAGVSAPVPFRGLA